MPADREAQFKQMVTEFPDSPMGYFSLGKLYLESRRYAEAADCLERAVRLQPEYAAGLVALAEAHVGAGEPAKARAAYQQARQAALAQNHRGLAEEIDHRLAELPAD